MNGHSTEDLKSANGVEHAISTSPTNGEDYSKSNGVNGVNYPHSNGNNGVNLQKVIPDCNSCIHRNNLKCKVAEVPASMMKECAINDVNKEDLLDNVKHD